mgnify:CR=1 FL=1
MKQYFIIFSIIIFLIITRFFVIALGFKNINIYTKEIDKDSVNIVFITDNNYIMPLSIAIKSAIYNKNKNSKYHFYIVGEELSKNNIEKLEQMQKDNIKISVVNQKDIYKIMPSRHLYITKADLFKFNLANIFEKFDKILYLDCDIIVNKDLKELYEHPLDDKYAVVVEDILINSDKEDIDDFYFNNGVLLLNLKKMRKDNTALKFLFYKYFISQDRFMTQDSFNFVFKNNVYTVSPLYNLIAARYTKENEKYLYNYLKLDKNKYPKLSDYVEDAAIIHFAGMDKPWNKKEMPWGYIWEKYAK